MNGRQNPIRNQMKNDEPLILPMTPVESPKKMTSTSADTRSEHP